MQQARCAWKLSEFYAAGGFEKISRYREVLLTIANDGGDDWPLFIVQNGDKLHDENLEAFLAKPLDYAERLRDLESGGAEVEGGPPGTKLAAVRDHGLEARGGHRRSSGHRGIDDLCIRRRRAATAGV